MERYSNIESKEQLAYLKRQDLQQLCKLHGLKAKRKVIFFNSFFIFFFYFSLMIDIVFLKNK